MGPESRTDQMFLATMPPGPKDERLTFIIILLSIAFFLIAAPFARVPLTPVWAFIPIYEAALCISDLITASLLFAKFSILRSRALLVLACGYLFTSLIVVPHALTFPGLFAPAGVIGGNAQSTAWLYMAWHAAFPAFVIAYSVFKRLDDAAEPRLVTGRAVVIGSIVATFAACFLVTILVTEGRELLPNLMVNNGYAWAYPVVTGLVWILSPIALAVLWTQRQRSVIDLWLMVVMCAWTFDVGLSAVFNAGRFDLGFYAGRIYGLIAATSVLLILLAGTAELYARIIDLLAAEKRERERTAEALSESLTRLRTIFSSAAISILTLNESGTVESLNPATERLFGVKPTDALRRDVCKLVNLGGANDINSAARLRQLLADGPLLCPFVGRHADGTTFPVEAMIADMIIGDRRMFVIFIHDGRGKKLAEEKFRLAVESCPSGIVMIGAKSRIILANAETERLFGFSREELLDLRIEHLLPRRFRAMRSQLPEAFQDTAKDRNLFGLRKNGEEFPIEVSLNPIQTSEGPATLCIIVDVSERKHNERMKNEFVATVSHELRTPLTSIAASLGLLQASAPGEELPDPTKRLLKIALENSRRLGRLINDILDIEKIESGKVDFNMQLIDVRPLIEQAIESNRGFADQFGVVVRIDPQSVDAVVHADADRLTQVITNLLSNAAKFSYRDGTVVIGVTADDEHVRISVQDQGLGIPDKFKPHVFEKFAQADASDIRQKGGTGLGLSIARQIMWRFKGDLRFEDAPGGGAIFHAELPTRFAQDELTILLCDDDADAAIVVAEQLRLAGFATDVAHSADEAIHNASQRRYAAILVDLQLPDRDGISLIKQLRSQWHYQNTPIIVVSANPERGQSDKRSAALNILDWLAKPVDIERLVRVLGRPIVRDANPRPRILHVDDDQDIRQLVHVATSKTADVVSVGSVEQARIALQKDTFDLAVIDIALESGVGLDLLPDLRDRLGYPIPVVVLSGQNTSEISTQVYASLTKSRASIDTLAKILRHIAADPQAHRMHPIREVA